MPMYLCKYLWRKPRLQDFLHRRKPQTPSTCPTSPLLFRRSRIQDRVAYLVLLSDACEALVVTICLSECCAVAASLLPLRLHLCYDSLYVRWWHADSGGHEFRSSQLSICECGRQCVHINCAGQCWHGHVYTAGRAWNCGSHTINRWSKLFVSLILVCSTCHF